MSEIAKIKGYDIRDKKLADATSASSVASTDAIRMKTTTGDEVYIDRDSFVGAIASVFKANNSSTVTSLFGELTADNESSPCSINMSNLASVLSVADLAGDKTSLSDLNDHISGVGVYRVYANTQNVPAESSGTGVLFVCMLEDGHIGFQYYSDIVTGVVWLRTRYYNNGAKWSNWR